MILKIRSDSEAVSSYNKRDKSDLFSEMSRETSATPQVKSLWTVDRTSIILRVSSVCYCPPSYIPLNVSLS